MAHISGPVVIDGEGHIKEPELEPEKPKAPPPPDNRKFFKLKARGKWVLIRMVPREERRTEGGIVVSTAQAKTQHGIIEDFDASEVKNLEVGQHVVFTNFVTELDDVEELTGERNLYLVREEEIYAGGDEITDPEKIADIKARIDERYANIHREETAAQ